MKRTITAATVAALTLAALTGCTRTVYVKVPATAAASPSDTPLDSPAAFDYQLETPTVTLATKSKQCFGSAGCDVTVTPSLAMNDTSAIPADATGSVTYEIDGGSDGPVIDTITLTAGQYEASEVVLSTASTDSRLTVKVTDVTTD